MTNYYFPIICIVPLISVDGQASPRLFIPPEIRHEKSSSLFVVSVLLRQFMQYHIDKNRKTVKIAEIQRSKKR